MVRKRLTPEDDFKRLAERIWQESNGKIQNSEDFNRQYNTYMQDTQQLFNENLKKRTFKHIQQIHKQVKLRRGESFSPPIRRLRRKHTILARSGKKQVMAREERIIFKGKEVIRLRGENGRFAKRILDKQ